MDSPLYTPFTTGQVLLHVTICLYLLCRINKSANSCDSSPDYHVMSSPGGIYTLGLPYAFPHHPTTLHSSPYLAFTSLYPLFTISAFIDGNMGSPSSNEEMQANWAQYTPWQCYMLTKNIEAAETTRHLDQQHRLLEKVLVSLFNLQLEFKAYKDHSPCQSCGRRGVQSPPPVSRGHGGRIFF